MANVLGSEKQKQVLALGRLGWSLRRIVEATGVRRETASRYLYYQFGERTVHLDGAVEVEGAYYHLPPGHLGRRLSVQWDALHVRILDPKTGVLLREHVRRLESGRRSLTLPVAGFSYETSAFPKA